MEPFVDTELRCEEPFKVDTLEIDDLADEDTELPRSLDAVALGEIVGLVIHGLAGLVMLLLSDDSVGADKLDLDELFFGSGFKSYVFDSTGFIICWFMTLTRKLGLI